MSAEHPAIGPWRCIALLGQGGNGRVWRATRDTDTTEVALKVVKAKNPTAEPYKRFAREIRVLRDLGHFDGVLPVLDAYLPDRPTRNDRPWLSMPIATPISQALDGAGLREVVAAMACVADTLARLSEVHGIGHRDIKPGNLYELGGGWLVGDFGLVDVPGAEQLTRSDRPLGPAHFTAYEVILDPRNAAAGPADVYSLGKTLWVLATGVNWPPLGHQRADASGHRIFDHRPHENASALDRLVDQMTKIDPTARPTMRQVASDLAAWQQLSPAPDALDVTHLAAQFRAKVASELQAHDLREERRDLAYAAIRSLQDRCKPLNEALAGMHPRPEIDRMGDQLTENMLGSSHAHWGREAVVTWIRCSRISVGAEHHPFVLQIGRCVKLLDDGVLMARWMVVVGVTEYAGGTVFHEDSPGYEAPVGSVEQELMLDGFTQDLRDKLQDALRVFVEKAPAAS